jgi:adenylate cyclase
MHVYLRGDRLQKIRLASGLVLFAFAGTHVLNHAVGLIGLEAMHEVQAWRTTVTRSLLGSLVLGAALVAHMGLGLYKLIGRRTWRMPLWEAAQILLALAIPFLLFPHIVNTRVASSVFGVRDTYLYELARLWPDRSILQSLLLLIVWAHGCVGLHYWLRLTDGYWRYAPALLVCALAVPVLAIAGFAVSGGRTAEIMSDPEMLANLKRNSNWPNAADSAVMAAMREWAQYGFAIVLALIGAFSAWQRRPQVVMVLPVQVNYVDGPTVAVPEGMTLLEVSRANGVPHASLCGGRSRCTTCRVRVEKGLKELGPPGQAEAVALKSIEAAPNVRLACQIRPKASLTVSVLLRPDTAIPSVLDFLEVKEVAAAHVRAVSGVGVVDKQSAHSADLGSWFDSKVAYRVQVDDLGEQGFPLLGGRLDYLLDKPVATLVYGREDHPISLFVLPAQADDAIAVRGTKHGYNVVGWSDGTFAYFAASDLSRSELDKLEDVMAKARGAATSEIAPEGQSS